MDSSDWFASGRAGLARIPSLVIAAFLTTASATTSLASDCRDLDRSGKLTTVDALIALRGAVGLGDGFTCPPCEEGFCGDGKVAPFVGTPFDGGAEVATCLLLSVSNPDDPSMDLDVVVVKALDGSLAPVGNVSVQIDNLGCDCFAASASTTGGRASESRASERGSAAALPATTTTQIPDESCNCMVRMRLDSPNDLAVVELEVDPADGYCDAVAVDGAETDFDMWGPMRIDAGVAEECDDGNSLAGDGCSADCRLETGAPVK